MKEYLVLLLLCSTLCAADPIGTLYAAVFSFTGGALSFVEISYLTGNITILSNINVPNAGSLVYYNSAIDVTNDIFYLSIGSVTLNAVYAYNLPSGAQVEIYPGSNLMPIVSHYPGNGLIYEFNTSASTPTIQSFDTNTQKITPIAPVPQKVYWKDSLTAMIPSFNNRTNSLIFTGFYSYSTKFPFSGPQIDTLFSLNVETGLLNSTVCPFLFDTGVWYDPVLDKYFTMGYPIGTPIKQPVHNIAILEVGYSDCSKTNWYTVPHTFTVYGWFQLFTFDPYSGYLFAVVNTDVIYQQILTVDLRNKQLISEVALDDNYGLFSPMQFLPFDKTT